MKIALACDHGGLALKKQVVIYLKELNYEIVDFGTDSYDSCDYPDFGVAAAEAVASGACWRGIVVCTTGIGMSIAANKVPGVRCALCYNASAAEMTRKHNNANVLALGAAFTDALTAREIIKTFLGVAFSKEDRHQRRIDKITETERKYSK